MSDTEIESTCSGTSNYAAAQVLELTKLRNQAYKKIQRIKEFLSTFHESTSDISEVKARGPILDKSFIEFNNLQKKLSPFLEEDEIEEMTTFVENMFYSAKALYSKLTDVSTNPSRNRDFSFQQNQLSASVSARLPEVSIPDFLGNDETEYASWSDIFKALVIDQSAINDIQKFHYLKGSCKGHEPRQIINKFEFTSSGFKLAWKALEKRYKNTRRMVNAHISNLFNLKSISKNRTHELRDFINEISANLESLRQWKQPVDQWDSLLIHIVLSKLPDDMKGQWELQLNLGSNDLPSFQNLLNFLEKRCTANENVEKIKQLETTHCDVKKTTFDIKKRSYVANSSTNEPKQVNPVLPKCFFCVEKHNVYMCPTFKQMSVNERRAKVPQMKLCFNCLRPGHMVNNCKSLTACRICSKRHHTLLHLDTRENHGFQSRQIEPLVAIESSNLPTQSFYSSNEVLLATALVDIKGSEGSNLLCRAFLDGGSQSNFITEEMCDKLQLKKNPINVPVKGISGSTSTSKFWTNATFYSKAMNFRYNLNFLGLSCITNNLPAVSLNLGHLEMPQTVKLADPEFYKSSKVDILIGAQIFFKLLLPEQKILCEDGPILQNTLLGWVVSGEIDWNQNGYSSLMSLESSTLLQINKYWEQEELCNVENQEFKWTFEERQCEKHFKETIQRDNTGRFVAKLPLREDPTVLGESKKKADNCLLSMERRFQSKPDLWNTYVKAMQENFDQGYMVPVSENEENQMKYKFYHPHHGVTKTDRKTTKLRVVYNSSSKSSTGKSLNDILMIGPAIQGDLFGRLIRFRKYRFVATADIRQMYPQIQIAEDHTALQLLRWRKNPTEPIQTYRFVRLMFGLTSAPFIAQRCLKQLAVEEGENFPKAIEPMNKDFYMDDLLTGSDNAEDLKEILSNVNGMLKTAQMHLRKFSTNEKGVLDGIPNEEIEENSILKLDAEETIKTLGLFWTPDPDILSYRVALPANQKYTKRYILSITAKTFDPIGLLCPVTIAAKLLNQDIWTLKVEWDDPLPESITEIWERYCQKLSTLDNMKIPRYIYFENPIQIEIHGFCDASEKAFGAAIYARVVGHNDNTNVQLICSKSKVAPLKKTTLARLELCASLLLANLVTRIIDELNVPASNIICWSDSTIVLCWISNESAKWNTYVANRVAEIQRLTKSCTWKHIDGKTNPADLISRSIEPDKLEEERLWWHGPDWLSKPKTMWPETIIEVDMKDIPERKKLTLTVFVTEKSPFHRNSSYQSLKNGIARFKRFIKLFKSSVSVFQAETIVDIFEAEIAIIRWEQNYAFSEELSDLKKFGYVKRKSKLFRLNPFIDTKTGIIRVGSRLKNAEISEDQKYPMVLPSNSNLSKLIAIEEHERLLHIGAQGLLYSLRQKYWPLSGRNLCKKVVFNCLKCHRIQPKPANYLMGDLPKTRVQPSRAFINVGIDYAGPFSVKTSSTRKSSVMKSWICVFVCFSTKAVHMELVTDLSSETFIAALKRFIGRRGHCAKIMSDNATTFTGANKELREIYEFVTSKIFQKDITKFLNEKSILWEFIPAYAASFGGLWEAAVKSMKFHLKRIMNEKILTYEEFYTVLTQVEAVLNSRPICQISEDATDPIALSPGHFLIGEPLMTLLEPDLMEKKQSLLKRWKFVTSLTQQFWKRWSSDYLGCLHNRSKWLKDGKPVNIGDLVLVRDDKLPPTQWLIGPVSKIHPGTDGRIRVVTIKTIKGELKRALSHISPLPQEN